MEDPRSNDALDEVGPEAILRGLAWGMVLG